MSAIGFLRSRWILGGSSNTLASVFGCWCNRWWYRSFNSPSGAAHGGAALYIHNSIPHHEIDPFKTESMQVAGIVARLFCGTEVVIAALYSPPKHKISENEYSLLFEHLGPKWILGGDYNAKHQHWGSRITTTKGRELL